MNDVPAARSSQRKQILDDLEKRMESLHVDSLHQLTERLRPYHLTIAQYLALAFVANQEEPSTLSEIGAHIGAPPSSMTSIVDRMVNMELVVREQHPDDRRSFRVSVTPEGRKLLDEISRLRRQDFEFLLEGISNGELERLAAILRHLQMRVGELLHHSRER